MDGTTKSVRPIDADEVLFQKIADSDTLDSAPKLRKLLLYLWQNRGAPISEYAIAVEGLGRRTDFDPKLDAAVRVEIARLRRKLKEFYETEGEDFPLRLSIPKGGHALDCVRISPGNTLSRRLLRSRRIVILGLFCTTVVLSIVCLFLLVRGPRGETQPAAGQMPDLWRSFFTTDKPTSVVIPAPTLFYWPDQLLQVRDMRISDFPDWETSSALRDLSAKLGPPQLDQRFVFIGDTFAGLELLDYFRRFGKEANLAVTTNVPVDYSPDRNIVFVGGPRTTGRLKESLENANFYIAASNPTVIKNRNPLPGEPLEYVESVRSDQRRTIPGIIILLPDTEDGTRSLSFIGRYPSTLVSLLLTSERLEKVEDLWEAAGRPEAWEMVVQADMQGSETLKVWPLAFREIEPSSR